MPIRTSITGFPQCLQFSRACKKQRNKQKEPFWNDQIHLCSLPLEKKASHAAPCPPRQERSKSGNRQQWDPLVRTLLTQTGNSQAHTMFFTWNTTTKFWTVSVPVSILSPTPLSWGGRMSEWLCGAWLLVGVKPLTDRRWRISKFIYTRLFCVS